MLVTPAATGQLVCRSFGRLTCSWRSRSGSSPGRSGCTSATGSNAASGRHDRARRDRWSSWIALVLSPRSGCPAGVARGRPRASAAGGLQLGQGRHPLAGTGPGAPRATAATTARRAASGRARPAARPAASAPLSVSPAPTVVDHRDVRRPEAPWTAGRDEQRTVGAEADQDRRARRQPGRSTRSSGGIAGLRPGRRSATASSPRFGVRMSARPRVGRIEAAGRRRVEDRRGARRPARARSASRGGAVGISWPTRTTSPGRGASARERRRGRRPASARAFAPLATAIMFSPRASTRMSATPVGSPSSVDRPRQVDPLGGRAPPAPRSPKRVVADRADERTSRHPAAPRRPPGCRPCRRDAARTGRRSRSRRAPGSRSTVDDQVDVDRPDDDDAGRSRRAAALTTR